MTLRRQCRLALEQLEDRLTPSGGLQPLAEIPPGIDNPNLRGADHVSQITLITDQGAMTVMAKGVITGQNIHLNLHGTGVSDGEIHGFIIAGGRTISIEASVNPGDILNIRDFNPQPEPPG